MVNKSVTNRVTSRATFMGVTAATDDPGGEGCVIKCDLCGVVITPDNIGMIRNPPKPGHVNNLCRECYEILKFRKDVR